MQEDVRKLRTFYNQKAYSIKWGATEIQFIDLRIPTIGGLALLNLGKFTFSYSMPKDLLIDFKNWEAKWAYPEFKVERTKPYY